MSKSELITTSIHKASIKNILSIEKEDDRIVLREPFGFGYIAYTEEGFLELLNEIIDWVKKDGRSGKTCKCD